MKNRLWLLQIPIMLFFTFNFWVSDQGNLTQLTRDVPAGHILRENVFKGIRVLQGFATDLKFSLRGPTAPMNRIVVVDIDNETVRRIGRWPWHRDATAQLIQSIFDAGAKAVTLDTVFSEEDPRVQEGLKLLVQSMAPQIETSLFEGFETDQTLQSVISANRERLVLGWAPSDSCVPRFMPEEALTPFYPCPLFTNAPDGIVPSHQEKFGIDAAEAFKSVDPTRIGLMTITESLANTKLFSEAALHAGHFYALPDPDGTVRRTPLVFQAKGKLFPSIGLQTAALAFGETPAFDIDDDGGLRAIRFPRAGREVKVNPSGLMEINFRGPSRTYQYIRAADLMDSNPETNQRVTVSFGAYDKEVSREEAYAMLKDSYAFVGLTATALYDMRPMPFDGQSPGVEGHVTILDNILAGDMFDASGSHPLWLYLLVSIGALLFAAAIERLQSVPALLFFASFGLGIAWLDIGYFFRNGINLNTSLLYMEYGAIFVFVLAVKYVLEEKNKKFIKDAFNHYLAPAVVESILKDPSKLSVGGEKKELTILFSDIRSFTTFSEKMDAKNLAQFLNEYLGTMTDLIFENAGTLDKYIGDAVMAFWGAPVDLPQHARKACDTAIHMQQKLAELRPGFKEKYGVDVHIGIGINTGHVNVGNMGSSRIFEYTVIGDSVNLASRLEGITKAYHADILTTRFTFDGIEASGESLPPHRPLDFVKVKGKKKAVELIEVLTRPMDPAGLEAFQEARRLYSNQKWDEAVAKFREANEKIRQSTDASDGPSEMFIERCEEFKKSPPPADWDGSWEMLSK